MKLSDKKVQRCKLNDELYVLELTYNLLNVSKAKTRLKFVSSGCDILDERQNVVATSTEVGSLYYLNSVAANKHAQVVMKNSNGELKETIWHRRYGHLG